MSAGRGAGGRCRPPDPARRPAPRRRAALPAALAPLALLALLLAGPVGPASSAAAQLPATRDAPAATPFAALVERLSEPGGYFDTDNLISNEASFLHVVGALRRHGVRGGAYIGVGPDQNFSYIARIRPELAVIVDIRRDNLLQQLLFRALFELSHDRAEYLGLLLGRPVPARRDARQPIEAIVAYMDRTPMGPATFEAAQERVRERLRAYGVPMSAKDLETIRRFHAAFAEAGLDLRFESFGRGPQSYYPTLRQLVLARDLDGRLAGYLASEDDFQFVRALEAGGRVIPVVGDLAGERALPAIAAFLKERRLPVSAYYVSNVEFYLAQEGKVGAFVENVKRLPRAPGGVLIRSVFRMRLPQTVPGFASTQLLQPLDSLVRAYDAGRIGGYGDLISIGVLDPR
ncbi:MAG TPA: hypothetical protein VFQ38_18630 [Longimicrobiales bacterium]|nr:hypothetical protein [Longimicrobiales bacterium]